MTYNLNRAMHLTAETRLKGATTKRARLEEEFGLPFERAQLLRRKYYAAGYSACREKTRDLADENKMLRQQVEGLRRQLEGMRARAA